MTWLPLSRELIGAYPPDSAGDGSRALEIGWTAGVLRPGSGVSIGRRALPLSDAAGSFSLAPDGRSERGPLSPRAGDIGLCRPELNLLIPQYSFYRNLKPPSRNISLFLMLQNIGCIVALQWRIARGVLPVAGPHTL